MRAASGASPGGGGAAPGSALAGVEELVHAAYRPARGGGPPSAGRRRSLPSDGRDLEQRDRRAAAAADPLQHGQPARQRARGAGVARRAAARRGLRGRAARRAAGSARTSSRACAARGDGPDARACSRTSTPCSPTPTSGSATRGRATSSTASCGAAARMDMKSQTAAEVGRRASRSRASGWRPARGDLLVVASSTRRPAAASGAQWLTENHPDARALRLRCSTRARGAVIPVRRRAPLRRLRAPRRASSASR